MYSIAVITGDLVDSTQLGPRKVEQAMQALRKCAESQADWMGADLLFTQHRGDGWQVVLLAPKYGLRSAILFRAVLRALGEEFDSYIGIAEGQIDRPPSANLNTENNTVFVASGRALDLAKTASSHINHNRGGGHAATAILLDRVCQEWTQTQAQDTVHALLPDNAPNYTELSALLGKSRQAVSKSLRSAWNDEIRKALNMLESQDG